jgi:FlaA1/EpsC-like NDP-sugar epimerase
VVILGADDEGERCVRDLLSRPADGRRVVGFLDADRRKTGRTIHGVPVLGTAEDLGRVAAAREVREVIVADLAAVEESLRARCRALGIAIRVHGLATPAEGVKGNGVVVRVPDSR